MRRAALAVVAAILVCTFLSSCSPAIKGAVGITVAGDGHLVAIFESCGSPVLGALLSRLKERGGESSEVRRWDFDKPPHRLDLGMLHPTSQSQLYEIAAWSPAGIGGTNNLSPTSFDQDDVDSLAQGQVLFTDPLDYRKSITSSRKSFASRACRSS